MNKFIKIGSEIINLDAVSSISFVENQSGISDRIIIKAGDGEVVIDSAIGGKARMEGVRAKLLATLDPELWDESVTEEQAMLRQALPPHTRAA